jgi:hypothetical protein
VKATAGDRDYSFTHKLSERQVRMVLAGGLIREIAEGEG